MIEPSASSFRTSTSWVTIGNVARAACQWAMVAVLVRRGSAEMVGEYALGLAISAPVLLMAGLQLNAVQVTDAAGEFSFEDYFSLRLVTAATAVAIVTLIVLAGRFGASTATVVLLLATSKAID